MPVKFSDVQEKVTRVLLGHALKLTSVLTF